MTDADRRQRAKQYWSIRRASNDTKTLKSAFPFGRGVGQPVKSSRHTIYNKMQSETADFAHGAATWRTRRNIRVLFDSGLFPPLYQNMTSYTKPEVHNVSPCCQRRTKPRSQVTCGQFPEIQLRVYERTNTQTDTQTDTPTAILVLVLEAR